MMKTLKQRVKDEKGLTLVEVLAVVVILGIVASMAVPAIGNIIEKNRGRALIFAVSVMNAAELYFLDTGKPGPVTLEELKNEHYLESQGRLTSAEVYYDEDNKLRIKAEGKNGNVAFNTFATGITYEALVKAEYSIIFGEVKMKGPNGEIYN